MRILSEEILQDVTNESVQLPCLESFNYPEKVLQFGTGVLLRALPDYYIDKANKQQVFKGRVAVIKSTSTGSIADFEAQKGVFTLCIKGVSNGDLVEDYIINNSISRVIEAASDWADALKIATSDDLEFVISNTTEVGIVLTSDDVNANPPLSFPGKLLSLLYQRYKHFQGDITKGLVILPTELISDNGQKLKDIILTLCDQNNLGEDFKSWLLGANDFCSTLVDRIVPGKLPEDMHDVVEKHLGYQDNLMIMAEPFALWAIESSSDRVKGKLSFAQTDASVVIVPSINKYKELKLRLLNATHTFSCAAALLSGFNTVKEAMQDEVFRAYVKNLMNHEIGLSILDADLTQQDVDTFSSSVIDRFSNPFLEHQWSAIAMNYPSKLALRCMPLLSKWYAKYKHVPKYMAFGIAAFIKMKAQNENLSVDELINDQSLWEENMTDYPDFVQSIKDDLEKLADQGVLKSLAQIL